MAFKRKRTARVAAILSILIFLCKVQRSWGHGRLVEPPARASMWRYGYDTPVNYSDNELNCGGYWALWRKHRGKCGVCGDEWDSPRDNEAGGRYASGIITRHYYPGEIITVKAEITAFHSGWMEFRLCENNDVNTPATEDCFQRHLLRSTEGDGTRYYFKPGEDKGMYTFKMKLPEEVTCSQCILRWRYHAGMTRLGHSACAIPCRCIRCIVVRGNSWGVSENGVGCMGCGQQEEFYGCSDIAISYSVPTPSYQNSYEVINIIQQNQFNQIDSEEDDDPWYEMEEEEEGRYVYAPFPVTTTTTRRTTTTTLRTTTTTKDPDVTESTCRAVGLWKGSESFDTWCVDNCASGYCPSSFCRC